jgi:mannitol/fructose-specific phosphotransferase system IIA component (Ntr-type)
MALSHCTLLKPELVALNLRAGSAADAIREVAGLLQSDPAVKDFTGFHLAILEREKINPTTLGSGIVMPHARTHNVSQIVMAAGRSRDGIWFETSGQTVHLIFVLGTPTGLVREYLGVVGGLTRSLRDQARREGLVRAETVEEFLSQLGGS